MKLCKKKPRTPAISPMASIAEKWEQWTTIALAKADKHKFLKYLPRVCLPKPSTEEDPMSDVEIFHGPGPWDRAMLEVEVEDPLAPSVHGEPARNKMLLFSGNDYLNLSTHPAVRKASAKVFSSLHTSSSSSKSFFFFCIEQAALKFGMGPRSSTMVSGHTDYHRRLENLLSGMYHKAACVVTPTGFAANTAFFSAAGAVASYNAASRRLSSHEKIAVFSDALNHASIIDGLRMMERHQQAIVSVYRHSDMRHLDELLSSCSAEKKIVVTDSLFSMEGDFAPMLDLVHLRQKHGFLLVVDEAHTVFVCGRNGGGIGEVYGIRDQIDVIIGTLSKAGGCLGGFVACSETWSGLVRGLGRPSVFTTASPLPIVAAAYAAVIVAKEEHWRREAVWNRVREFTEMTKQPASSPIVSLVVGTEDVAIRVSKHMLDRGFHVTAIRPPAVAPDACRLRVTLTTAHTSEDLKSFVAALAECLPELVRPAEQIEARL